MSKNKTGKYIKYAIGEIVLVVIGILIALSINSWNTQRLQDANALQLSVRLLAETERNISDFSEQLLRSNSAKKCALTMLQLISMDYTELDEHIIDSLMFKLYASPNIKFNSAVLNEALSTGEVSHFKNDSLKNLIYSLPSDIARVRLDEENMRSINESFSQLLYDNYSLRKMDYKFSSSGKILGKSKLPEFDNRQIVSSQRFENIVDEQYYQLNSMIDKYSMISNNLKTILELLKLKIDGQ